MAAVGALLDAGGKPHPPGLDDAILLHHHRVGAVRHRRAGEDPDRLAANGRAVERVAGGGAPADGQYRVLVGQQIGMRYRVAINRAVGVRRNIHLRDQVAGENAAARLAERRRRLLDDRRHPLIDQLERRIDPEQGAAEGEAILAQLRHHPNPRWSSMKPAIAAGSASESNGNGAANGSSEAIATMCGSSG